MSSIEKSVRPLTIERVKRELGYFLHKDVMQVKFIDRTFNSVSYTHLDVYKRQHYPCGNRPQYGREDRNSQDGRTAAVSYTHLDVYKRQGQRGQI